MHLSDVQRAGLDERIDVAALERFLDQFPAEQQDVIINGCLRDPDPDLGGVAEFVDRQLQREWTALWKPHNIK